MVLPLPGVGQGKFSKRRDERRDVWYLQYIGLPAISLGDEEQT